MNKKKTVSINNLLNHTNHLMIALAVIPLLVSIVIYSRYLFSYEKSINNIAEANRISNRVDEKLLDETWSVVYGQITVPDFQRKNELSTIKTELEGIQKNTITSKESAVIDVAIRSITNLEDYTGDILLNLTEDAPYEDNQELMLQFESSTAIVHEIIQNFVAVEIDLAAQQNESMRQSILTLSVIEIAILAFIIYIIRSNSQNLIRQIQHPVEEMVVMADELSVGHLNYRVNELPQSELRVLGQSMNQMADRLVVLLEENALKQYNLAQSEVRTLQAQITPHFVYNSLDAILTLAEEGEIEDVKTMTYALSDFFRISLSQGQDWITIRKELKHIQDYLTILKIRYGEDLDYQITIEPVLLDYHMLKMVLQPFVENAVYHGTKLVRRTGEVVVIGVRENGSAHFQIRDNGRGIQPEQLAKINQELAYGSDTEFTEGYGMFNVAKRLTLYYGREAMVWLESQWEIGTIVHVVIPLKEVLGEDEQ